MLVPFFTTCCVVMAEIRTYHHTILFSPKHYPELPQMIPLVSLYETGLEARSLRGKDGDDQALQLQ